MDTLIILAEQNPWWEKKQVPDYFLGKYQRELEKDLLGSLKEKKVTILYGLRRAGKTTFFYKTIQNLIINKITSPERILFINFENLKLRKLLLRDIISLYLERLGETLSRLPQPLYLFFDEIHNLDHWSEQIKELIDLKLKIKIFAAGSSSYKVIRGAGESLVGRGEFKRVFPLSFFEFLKAKYPSLALNERIKEKKEMVNLVLRSNEYNRALEDYFITGGFPEILEKSPIEQKELIRMYKLLILQRDIVQMKKINEPLILSDLYDLLTEKIASKLSITNLSQDLGIKFETAKKYLSYLEEVFFIKLIKPYARKKSRMLRKERKIFFIDNALATAFLLEKQRDEFLGRLAENTLLIELLRKSSSFKEEVYYGQVKNGKEIDFVFGDRQLLEVKYQSEIKKEDELNLWEFMKINDDLEPILLTKKTLDLKGKVKKIPLFIFLLKAN